MQEATIGHWAREPRLASEHLNSIRELNHRFLDLSGSRGSDYALCDQLAPLSRAQRAAAANCPYALFDLRFEDDDHWQRRLQNAAAWRVADDPGVDAATLKFVQLAIFYVWHVASSGGLAAQLLMGMHRDTAGAFRRLTLDSLPTLAATEAAYLKPRWSHCSAYWRALIGAAARSDAAALRRVQLYGLQLSAASRLPNP